MPIRDPMLRKLLQLGGVLLVAASCARPQANLTPGALPSADAPEGIPSEAWTNALAAHRQASLEGLAETALKQRATGDCPRLGLRLQSSASSASRKRTDSPSGVWRIRGEQYGS